MSTQDCVHIHTGYPQPHKSCANRHEGRPLGPGEGTGVIPRLVPDTQLELFPGAVLYLSQAHAAEALGISTRHIQYWEKEGLLHPEYPHEGRSRRYTQKDLVELAFVKAMVLDQGYSVPALKEKLQGLPAPYYYDARDVFWDMRVQGWRSRAMLAGDALAALQERLAPALADLLRRLEGSPDKAAASVLGLVRDGLAGRLSEPKRRPARRKPRPAPALEG